MSAASNVVATTPFLTVDQVAGELGITPLGVRRLIALKLLTANRMVAETGEWKITPAALEQYAASNRKRMLMPALDAGWFNDTDIRFRGELFLDEVRGLLIAQSPAECPLKDRDGVDQDGSIEVTGPVLTKIVALARQPLKVEVRRVPQSPETRFPNVGTAYLAAELSRRAGNVVRKQQRSSTLNSNGDVAAFFDSPESYQQSVDAGWANFRETKISASRLYSGSRNAMVSFGVPHTLLTNAIGLSTVEPLTF